MAAYSMHITNIADNLPLLADLGFASVVLAVPDVSDATILRVIASYRSTTAVAPLVPGIGTALTGADEPEACAALAQGTTQRSTVSCEYPNQANIAFYTHAHPVFATGDNTPHAVIIRHIAQAAIDHPGRMEEEFFALATEITDYLTRAPLLDTNGSPFFTTRRPGDGVLRVDATGDITYPSPNAVALMRRVGFDQRVRTSPASALPGGGFAITPVLGTRTAVQKETEILGRTLLYRSIGLSDNGALVLVEDITELRRQQVELANRDEIISEIRAQVQNLSDQLETRKALDRAKAILMERGMSEAQSFAKLQKTAMDHRKPLKEVCEVIILSDEFS